MASNAVKLCTNEGGSDVDEFREDFFTIDLSTGQRIKGDEKGKLEQCEEDKNDKREVLQTYRRKDSSENIVIEIRPNVHTPSPPPLELKRAGSMENVSAKDYLVVRANRKQKIKQKNLQLQNDSNDDKYKFPTEPLIIPHEYPVPKVQNHMIQNEYNKERLEENSGDQSEIPCKVINSEELTETQQKSSVGEDPLKDELVQGGNLTTVSCHNEKTNNFCLTKLSDNSCDKQQQNEADRVDDEEEMNPVSGNTSQFDRENGYSPFFASDEDDEDIIQVATFCMQKFDDDDDEDDIDDLLQNVPVVYSDDDMSETEDQDIRTTDREPSPSLKLQDSHNASASSDTLTKHSNSDSENHVQIDRTINTSREINIVTESENAMTTELGISHTATVDNGLICVEQSETSVQGEDISEKAISVLENMSNKASNDKDLQSPNDVNCQNIVESILNKGEDVQYVFNTSQTCESNPDTPSLEVRVSNTVADKFSSDINTHVSKKARNVEFEKNSLQTNDDNSSYNSKPENLFTGEAAEEGISMRSLDTNKNSYVKSSYTENNPTDPLSQGTDPDDPLLTEVIENPNPECLISNLKTPCSLISDSDHSNSSLPSDSINTDSSQTISHQGLHIKSDMVGDQVENAPEDRSFLMEQPRTIEPNQVVSPKHSNGFPGNDTSQQMPENKTNNPECDSNQHASPENQESLCMSALVSNKTKYARNDFNQHMSPEQNVTENYPKNDHQIQNMSPENKTDCSVIQSNSADEDIATVCSTDISVQNFSCKNNSLSGDDRIADPSSVLNNSDSSASETAHCNSNVSIELQENALSCNGISSNTSSKSASVDLEDHENFELVLMNLDSHVLPVTDPAPDSASLNMAEHSQKEDSSDFDVLKHNLLLKNLKLKSCTKTDSVTTDGDYEVEEIMRNEVINDADVFQPIAMVATEICNEFTDETKEAVFLDDPFPNADDGNEQSGRWSGSYLSGCTSEESVYVDANDSSGEDYSTWETFQSSPVSLLQEAIEEAEEEEKSGIKIVEVSTNEAEDDKAETDDSEAYKTVINLDSLQETLVPTEKTEEEAGESTQYDKKCVIFISKPEKDNSNCGPCLVNKSNKTTPCMAIVPWRRRTRTCPCVRRKKLLQASVQKYVKGHDQANLAKRPKKLYDIIHGINRREAINLPTASDFDNDMIWKLLKSLIRPEQDLFEELDTENSSDPSCSPDKENLVKVFTYLHPSTNKSKFEFIPLKTPRKKTLPFNVKELFNKEVARARKKKEISKGLIFLKMITGKNTFIKEKGSPKRKVSMKNKETDATIKSPKMFKMSSTHLVLPKLSLIGRPVPSSPKSPAHSPKELLEEGLLNRKVVELEEMSHDASPTLNSMLSLALEMLHTSRLDDAENQLLHLYQRMQEKPEENTRVLVQCLSNLSDICVRRSRMCRSNQMEWQWLVMHAIALLQYTVEICQSEIEATQDNQDVEWFQEFCQNIVIKCKPLEDSFNRALYNCLKHEGRKFMDPYRSFSLPNTPTMPNRLGLFPLASSHQFYINPGLNYKYSSTLNREKKESMDDISVGLDWLSKFYRYCNDRLQTKNLGNIYNKLFKKRTRIDSLRHEDDTESVVSDSAGSLDWDHSDLRGIDELDSEESEESPITEQSFALAVAECDMENNGWDFFLNDRKNCKFTSVVQVASQTQNNETEKLENKAISKMKENENEGKEKEIISPLHEHSIKHTLAKSYSRLAEKMLSEGELDKAEVLFEQVLNIIEEIHDGTAGMLRFSAQVSKFLGTIKSKQGKTAEGLEYLNTALKTYRDLQDDASNYEIAVALLELGNGYSVGKNNDDGVFEDAIGAICEFFEKDLSDENMSSSTSSGKSDVNSRTAEEEENIKEAIHCYREALSLIDAYKSENQMDVVAKSTMRLGDCYFMQKDYDRALECYEKSLSLFHSSSTLGRESMLEQAHVMCMVGVCSFMLHMYPRAASTFDLALHLIKYAYGLTSTFIHALLLSMMGITYYKMKNYHKCVTMCYQGFEIFCSIHGEKLSTLPKRKFWLVCQILYVMGNSYNILNLHQKATKYLTVARTLMMACKMRERRQFMRVLQVLGDCYFAQYDYKTALQFYNEALEYGDCESQVSFDEVFDPNAIGDNMTMHNQLVSKSAEAHISMQQYQNAVHYLEQAHDMQEDMGNDIKEDLIHTLTQLGQMHSSAGDVDQAIDSFNESLEVYREIHDGKLGKEMCSTLGNLATMCYVKACLCEEIDRELEMILTTEQHFQDAMALDLNPSVCVKYANFLYSQGNYDDAILYLEDALKIDSVSEAPDITYGGLEKVTLPDCLQDEVDSQEEVVLSPTILARYLLILSHKSMHQFDPAMSVLIDLQKDVLDRDIPIFYSVLGYAMMEMSLFEEAMWCFSCAVDIESDYRLALDNYSLCLCIYIYKTFINGIEAICKHFRLPCYYNF